MKKYLSNSEYWQSELHYMHDVEVWKAKAIELKLGADLFVQREQDALMDKLPKGSKAFFPANMARMLMAYALENLIKAHFFHDNEQRKKLFTIKGNLKGAIQWHKLNRLVVLVGIELDDSEKDDLELLEMCSVWKGRYPFPINESKLPRKRRPMASREALFKRRIKEIDKAMEEGKPLRADLWDRTHTSIGTEYDTFNKLFDLLCEQLESIEKKAVPC